MTVEMNMLTWSLVLALFQMVLATVWLVKDVGLPYAASPRDTAPKKTVSVMSGRLSRAQRNMLETLPIFIGLVLIANALNVHNEKTTYGAMMFFWGRLVYVPVYMLGIPHLRTAVWAISIAGIVMFMVALLCPGA